MTQPHDGQLPEVAVAAVPIDGGPAVVLDVRENDEWRRGHAPGAHHIPLADISDRMAELSREHPLYVVCKAGGRSSRAAQYLRGQGYQVFNVTGGMLAWAAAGRSVVTDDGSIGTV